MKKDTKKYEEFINSMIDKYKDDIQEVNELLRANDPAYRWKLFELYSKLYDEGYDKARKDIFK